MKKEHYSVEKISVGTQGKNNVATLKEKIPLRRKGKQKAQI